MVRPSGKRIYHPPGINMLCPGKKSNRCFIPAFVGHASGGHLDRWRKVRKRLRAMTGGHNLSVEAAADRHLQRVRLGVLPRNVAIEEF